MVDVSSILVSLFDVVDLGFNLVPTIIPVAAKLILLGLRFRKSLLSYTGVVVIFADYFLLEMAAAS